MSDYAIDVTHIETLQTINDADELDRIFNKAKSAIVQGELVLLTRKNSKGAVYTFDEISTEADLATYKKSVYKYIAP